MPGGHIAVFFNCFPTMIFWRRGLSLKSLELNSLVILVDQQAPRILLSLPPCAEVTSMDHCTIVCSCQGSKLRPSCLLGNHLLTNPFSSAKD